LNKKAHITFNNIVMNKPRILKDGQVCSAEICSEFNYNSDTKEVTVKVTGFSVYSVEETPQEQQQSSSSSSSSSSSRQSA